MLLQRAARSWDLARCAALICCNDCGMQRITGPFSRKSKATESFGVFRLYLSDRIE
jgi:hypothetical protein